MSSPKTALLHSGAASSSYTTPPSSPSINKRRTDVPVMTKRLQPIEKDKIFEYIRRMDSNSVYSWMNEYGKETHLTFDDKGWTPIHFAAHLGHAEILNLLLSPPCPTPNPLDKKNDITPLIIAAQTGNPTIIKCLIDHNANIQYKDMSGRDALAYARKFNHLDAIRLLNQAQGPSVVEKMSGWVDKIFSLMDPYNSSSVSGEDANRLHLQNTHQLHFASSQSHPQIPQSLAQANLQSHKTQVARKRDLISSSQDHSSDDDSDSKEGATEQDKKLRRLLKNRESAHQSRIRKKNYISELEKRTAELSSSNSDLQTRVNTLTTENKLLKDQLAYLRLVLSQAATSAYPTPIGSQPPSQAYPPTPLNAQSASQAFAGIASSMQFANTLSQTGLFDPPRK